MRSPIASAFTLLSSLALMAGCYGADAPVDMPPVPPPEPGDAGANVADAEPPTGPSEQDLASVTGCNSSDTDAFRQALGALSDRWSTFESRASAQGTNLGACIENRVKSNGEVRCVSSTTGSCASGAAGYSSCLSTRANVCQGWRTQIRTRYAVGSAEHKICYGAMAAHEFTHSCCEGENNAEKVELAAFQTLRSYYNRPNMNWADCLTQ